jgi:hypothetical protein
MICKIVCFYASEDKNLLKKLKAHLRPLEQQHLIKIWCSCDISAGADREQEVKTHVHTAHVILLLISSAFLDSNYCYESEMKWAIQRHKQGNICVIPIILRPCLWQATPFGKLQALPKDGKAVALWTDRDSAFASIAEGIQRTVNELFSNSSHNKSKRGCHIGQHPTANPVV